MEITRDIRIVKSESTLLQELEKEAVLLNLDNNQYYRLDEDSLRMFTVLTSSENAGGAYETLAQEYDVDSEVLWQDLQGFIKSLLEAGLVTVVNEPAG